MSKWKSIVKGIAPSIATALGGPLAGMATKALSDGLLGKDNGTDSEIYESLMNPEGIAKLKQIEKDFEVKMKELDVDLEKIAVDDRKSARDMAKAVGVEPQVVLSSVFIIGFFFSLYLLFAGHVELDNTMENLAYLMLGVLGSGVTLILKFWFGGSPQDSQNLQNIYNSIPREQLKK